MKTIVKIIMCGLLFSGFSIALHAQQVDNPQEAFLENTWYLSKIEIDGTVYPFESNEETEYTTLTPEEIEGQIGFHLDYCSGASGELTFTTDTSFVLEDFVIPLAECDDPENNSYKVMYFDVFWDNLHEEFEYVITIENDHKSLVISTQDNSEIHYQNVPTMSVDDQQKSTLTVFPNPVKDFLYIKNLSEPAQIEIYDLYGKVLLNQEVNETIKQVNVSPLSDGIYLYQFNRKGRQMKTGKLVKN